MKLEVTPQAGAWFKEQVGRPVDEPNAGIRFKTKIYGASPINGQFALAIEITEPDNPIVLTKVNGISFFVEVTDAWFFDGHDLRVELDEQHEEPRYVYINKDGEELS